MSAIDHSFDEPGPSDTDQAADAAFAAIDFVLESRGHDPKKCYSLVMVLIPDGQAKNATVAGAMPNPSTRRLLEHALTQLQPLAAECGVTIVVTENARN